MRYTIISINDDRRPYKDNIRRILGEEEVAVPAFNAYDEDPIAGLQERGLELAPQWNNAKRGELGVWLSNYDCWKAAASLDGPLAVFEDDAIPNPYFYDLLGRFVSQVPSDWDFCALWVPDNQRQDFLYNATYDDHGVMRFNGYLTPDQSVYRIDGADIAALVYQGYGMVSLMYSPEGARKLVKLAHEVGVNEPVDCWIYQQAHKGLLKGYAPRPEHAEIVLYDWKAVSHVQLTERAI